MQSSSERRIGDATRVPLDVMIELANNRESEEMAFAADGVNLGIGGLQMRAKTLPEPGSKLFCRFESPDSSDPIEVYGTVVWAKREGGGGGEFGLRFGLLDSRTYETIRKLVWSSAPEAFDLEPTPLPVAARREGVVNSIIPKPRVIAARPEAKLFIDGVATAVVASVVGESQGRLTVEQDLPFLRIGSSVRTYGAGHEGTTGSIESVSVRVDGDMPKLVISVASHPGLGTLPVAHVEKHAEAPDVGHTWADEASPAEEWADEEPAESAAFETEAWERESEFAGEPSAVAAPMRTEDAHVATSKVARFAVPKPSEVRPIPQMGNPTVERFSILVDTARYHFDRVFGGVAPAVGRFWAKLMLVLRAWSERVRPAFAATAERTRIAFGNAWSAFRTRSTVVRSTRSHAPSRETQKVRARQPVKHSKPQHGVSSEGAVRRNIVVGVVGAVGLGAIGYSLIPAASLPLPVEAQVSAVAAPTVVNPELGDVTGMNAVSALPSALPTVSNAAPAQAPTVAAPVAQPSAQPPAYVPVPAAMPAGHYTAGRLQEPSYPAYPTLANGVAPAPAAAQAIPSHSPYADVNAPAQAAVAAPAPAAQLLSFGAANVPSAVRYALAMTAPVGALTGARVDRGFTVRIEGAQSTTPARPLVQLHPAIERAVVLNRGTYSELTVQFRAGLPVPTYRVTARGTQVEIQIAR